MKKFIVGMSAVAVTASLLGSASFAEGLKTIKVDPLLTVGTFAEQKGSMFEIKELEKDTWGDKIDFELIIPDGVKWNAKTTISNDYKATIDGRTLKFTADKNKRDAQDTINIIPYFDIERGAKLDKVSIRVSPINSNDKEEYIDVANIKDYSVSLGSSYKTASSSSKIPVELTLSEDIKNSLTPGTIYEIEFDNANVEPDTVKVFSEKGKDVLNVTNKKGNYIEFQIDEKSDDLNRWKINLDITPKKDYEGDIKANFKGRGVENISAIVAKVQKGLSSTRTPDSVIVGKADQKLADVTIDESVPASLSQGDYMLKISPEHKGVTINSGDVSVKSGDIKLGSSRAKDRYIDFSVRGESFKPSALLVSNLSITVDQSAYEGDYTLDLVNAKDEKKVITSIPLFNAKVEAPKVSDTIVFAIGNESYTVTKNNVPTMSKLEAAPYIAKGRTMIPVRATAESLDMKVDWNATTKTATLTTKDGATTVLLTIGKDTMVVNGKVEKLDSAPEIKNGRSFLPIGEISRALSIKTDWDGSARTVTITK